MYYLKFVLYYICTFTQNFVTFIFPTILYKRKYLLNKYIKTLENYMKIYVIIHCPTRHITQLGLFSPNLLLRLN